MNGCPWWETTSAGVKSLKRFVEEVCENSPPICPVTAPVKSRSVRVTVVGTLPSGRTGRKPLPSSPPPLSIPARSNRIKELPVTFSSWESTCLIKKLLRRVLAAKSEAIIATALKARVAKISRLRSDHLERRNFIWKVYCPIVSSGQEVAFGIQLHGQYG